MKRKLKRRFRDLVTPANGNLTNSCSRRQYRETKKSVEDKYLHYCNWELDVLSNISSGYTTPIIFKYSMVRRSRVRHIPYQRLIITSVNWKEKYGHYMTDRLKPTSDWIRVYQHEKKTKA